MSKKNVIKPLDDYKNIFNEVVEVFKKGDKTFNPIPIKPWGDSNNPLFNVKELENCLNKKNIRQVIAHDSKKADSVFTQGEDYVKHFALYNGKVQSMIFLTWRGVHNYLAVSRGKISTIYRKFLFVLLKKIVTKGSVYKEEAFKELKLMCEEAEKEKMRIEEEYLQLNDKNAELLLEKEKSQILHTRKDMMLKMKDKKISELKMLCEDMYDDDPYGDASYLNCVLERFMKKMYIHPFKKKSLRAKKNTTKTVYDDDELTDEEHDDIDVISFDDIIDKDDVRYYRLSPKDVLKDSNSIDFIYIGGPKHKKILINHIEKYASTEWAGIYKISINDLKLKARKAFFKT